MSPSLVLSDDRLVEHFLGRPGDRIEVEVPLLNHPAAERVHDHEIACREAVDRHVVDVERSVDDAGGPANEPIAAVADVADSDLTYVDWRLLGCGRPRLLRLVAEQPSRQ